MDLTRRDWLVDCIGGASIAAAGAKSSHAQARASSMGVVIHSYMIRQAADRALPADRRIDNPWVFLDHARTIGAVGVQVGIGIRSEAEANRLRDEVASRAMYLEGTIRLPRDEADVGRFEKELVTAKQAGAEIVRTVMMEGRRYETFHDDATFRRAGELAVHRLALASPVAARRKMWLAVENHKDWRVDELLAILKRVGGDAVGVCLDTGNSIALLEDPMHVVDALAPVTLTTHFKDMDVELQKTGFGLSEVPLGQGFLDLKRMVQLLRAARPSIRFNLEMITRNPLSIPCLTEDYWSTFATVSGRDLAQSLRRARERGEARKEPLAQVTQLPKEDQIRVEEANVRESLAFARMSLGL
jgi:3-oxoisoapionate decarboxylase